MNNLVLDNPNTTFRPHKTQTIYSCKKIAWLLFDALKRIEPTPTFKILHEISLSLPSCSERTPIDDLFYIYPYRGQIFDYKNTVSEFIMKKNIDLETTLSRGKILQFLAFCDGYPTWENMKHHLSQSPKKLITFSFVLNGNNQLDVYTFFDNDQDDHHGQKLITSSFSLPAYDARKLWGRSDPGLLRNFLDKIICFLDPELTENVQLRTKYVKILYNYLRDMEQVHPELLITELDLIQIIEFEMCKNSSQSNVSTNTTEKVRNDAFVALLKTIAAEKDALKMAEAAISFIKNSNFTFQETMEILNLFQFIEETQIMYKKIHLDPELHCWIEPWSQYICEKTHFMEKNIQSHLKFLVGEGKIDMNDIPPNFKAKNIFLSNCMYDVCRDELFVEGDYKFKFDAKIPNDEHSKNCEISGSFELYIDKDNVITSSHTFPGNSVFNIS